MQHGLKLVEGLMPIYYVLIAIMKIFSGNATRSGKKIGFYQEYGTDILKIVREKYISI